MPSIRLSKVLAQAGLTSRRQAEALLTSGRVTVNGRVRLEPGAQADPAVDAITVDGRPVPKTAPRAYLLLNKPRGYLSSRRDPAGRPVVMDLLPPGTPRLFPVGRLDWDAEGLLLLTNDGELGHRLLHPRYEIARVYEVEVEGHVTDADLRRWRHGVTLHDGPAVPAAVRIMRREGRRRGRGRTWLSLTFREGRNREVKRYCQALGHPVSKLRRVEFGPLQLGSLPPGKSRWLTQAEITGLERLRRLDPSPIMRGVR